MSRIPPVKIEWGQGANKELIRFLKDFQAEEPDIGVPYEALIKKIENYGREKIGYNGKPYDTLYLYEQEASDIIYSLVYLMIIQYVRLGKN